MNNTFAKGALLAATALGIGYEAPAYAQDVAEGDDIIVTARHSEEKLQDVPVSVTVFSQEKLNSPNIFSLRPWNQPTITFGSNARYRLGS